MKKILLLLFIAASTIFLSACEIVEEGKVYVSFDTYGAGSIPKVLLEDFKEFPEIDEKDGYDFGGWYFDRAFSQEATLEQVLEQTKSFCLYARWDQTIIYHDVTFIDYEGNVLKKEKVIHNGSVLAPRSPQKEGYTFIGWDKNLDEITASIVVQALYNINKYTVTFIDYDGTILKTDFVEYLSGATAPDIPIREDRIFLDWDRDFSLITHDIVITAVYDVSKIIITYNTDGGNLIPQATVAIGAGIPLPIPTREGYAFLGWTYQGANLTINKAYYNMTLLATWEAKKTYTISFDAKGGSSVKDMSVNNYEVIKSLPSATKSGREFLHWVYDGYIVNTPTVFNFQKDVTFEAVYTTTYLSSGSEVIYRNKSNKVMIPDTYAQSDEEFRGVWVSFITNDLSGYQNETQMKNQLTAILNNLVSWNMNAIVFHVRTHNNAYFDTDRDPKASYVSGMDFAEWDYLEWFIAECHKRDIEFHAWLNPYRLPSGTNAQTLANQYKNYPNNPASDVNNILVGNSQAILNPGEPVVRDYVIDVCMEIIEKYDVDAIHFDDYFYIAMPSNADLATYNKYKANFSTTNINDWRREQVNVFIRDLSLKMKAYNKISGRNVELGISPSGIWQNGTGSSALTYDANGSAITNGSNTAGMEHFGGYLFADTKKWIDEEWIDYIIPQTYWSFTQTVAQYAELADWWSAVVRNKNVKLYMGMGIYMTSYGWGSNPYEASDQVLYNTKYPEIKGVCIFRYGYIINRLKDNNAGTLRLINEYWIDKVKTPS